jgi:hypothetical protein
MIAALTLAASMLATEADYRTVLCDRPGWSQEVPLSNGTRADCLSPTEAIEIDFANKWAEAVGQSLSYAASTGKRPAIILICKRSQSDRNCLRWSLTLAETVAAWNLPIRVWLCPASAARLDDCTTGADTGGADQIGK